MQRFSRDLTPVEITEIQTALRLAAIHYRKLDASGSETWNTWAERCKSLALEIDKADTISFAGYTEDNK